MRERQFTLEEAPAERAQAEANPAHAPQRRVHDAPTGDGGALSLSDASRGAFMDGLGASILSMCNRELATVGRTADDCPYLSRWLAYYRGRSAADLERAIFAYARPRGRDLDSLRFAVEERVRA